MTIYNGATLWARQTIESDIFFGKPDKWFKIWFYLVSRVNHKDNKRFKRGQCLMKYEWVQERTRASRNQIDSFMRWAKRNGMISTQKTTRGMIITISNYCYFQDLDNYKTDTDQRQSGESSARVPEIADTQTDTGTNQNSNDNTELQDNDDHKTDTETELKPIQNRYRTDRDKQVCNNEKNENIILPCKNTKCPHKEIIEKYHQILPGLPSVKKWPPHLQSVLRARWNEDEERQNLEWWEGYFHYVGDSKFLMGMKTDWQADLEWIITKRKMTRILNGRYHKRGGRNVGIEEWLRIRREK